MRPRRVRFGAFEADFRTREIYKGGLRVRLAEQPFEVLELLLERPGELVLRETICERLWPGETFVEFDQGVNTAVRKLRSALGDSKKRVRFVETLPKRGYRFIASVEEVVEAAETRRGRRLPRVALAAAAAVLGLAVWSMPIGEERGAARVDALQTEELIGEVPSGIGAISPQGRQVVVMEELGGGLYLHHLIEGTRRRIVDEPLRGRFAWSESGRLAYACLRDGVYRLEAVDLESGEVEVLRTGSSYDEVGLPLSWDAGSKRLLCRNERGDRLDLVRVRDLTVTRIETPGDPFLDPALSPDGRWAVYARRIDGSRIDIEARRADGEGGAVRITSFDELETSPAWSPDGRHVLFTRIYGTSTNGKSELWAAAVDLRAGMGVGTPFLVSAAPDLYGFLGPKVLANGEVIWARREPRSRAYVIEVDPKTAKLRREINAFPAGSSAKRWSDDGPARLHYWDPSVRWPMMEHVLAFRQREMDSGQDRIVQIPWRPPFQYDGYSFTRDHSKGLVASRGGGVGYAYDPSRGEYSEVIRSELRLRTFNWSNDAGRVAYVEGDETPHVRGRCYLSVVDATTKAMRVLHESGRIGAPSWSPDDSEIAFVDPPCLKSADARSGEVATVACLPNGWTAENESSHFRGYYIDVCWSPDGRMLAWPVANPDKQRIELWAVDRVNGGHRVVWEGAPDYGARIFRPDWSHDGRYIAFTLVTDTMVEIRRLRDPRLMSGGGGD